MPVLPCLPQPVLESVGQESYTLKKHREAEDQRRFELTYST